MYKQRNTPMEKVIGQSVQKTNQTFLRRYVDDYCKALDENFKQDTIRSLEHNLKRDPECCLLYTSPSPRDLSTSRMPSSA